MKRTSITRFFFLVMLALTACGPGLGGGSGTAGTPTGSSGDQATAAAEDGDESSTGQAFSTPNPAEALPERPLSSTGPWLFYTQMDERGQLADFGTVNVDGTGRTPILETVLASYSSDEFKPRVMDFGLSPNGRYAAVQIQAGPANVALWIMKLPGGELIQSIPLVGAEARQVLENSRQGLSTITTQSFPISFLWSPDGETLMISGAIEGPSTDVYTFQAGSGALNRLTSGPGEAVLMGWSPDNRWLVFQSVAPATELREVDGVYALSSDGAQLKLLYEPVGTNIDVVVGWADNTIFIAYSAPIAAPATELRQIEITTGRVTSLLSGYFSDATKAPGSPVILVDLYGFPNYNPEVAPGIHRVSADSNEIAKFTNGYYSLITWIPELGLFASTQRTPTAEVTFFNADGETEFGLPRSHPTIRWPVVSPDGQYLATPMGDHYEVYTGGGELAAEIPGLGQILWLPDSSGFLQYTGGRIVEYMAERDWEGETLNPYFKTQAELQLINP